MIKERLYLDKGNADILRNEVTTIDHALTTWAVTRTYYRDRKASWYERVRGGHHVVIGRKLFPERDGTPMPTRKVSCRPI